MTPTTITSRVGADGSLPLPLMPAIANRDVRITVETIGEPPPMTEEQWAEWRAWVRKMAGSWQGDLERPPQGDYEEREPLP